MKNQKRRLWLLSTLAALAAGMSGTAFAQGNEITVGIINATSGVFAFGGVPIQNGMRLALEEANQKGMPGGAKIKIVEGDAAADKAQAISLVTQFGRRDTRVMIMGPTNSFSACRRARWRTSCRCRCSPSAPPTASWPPGPWAFKVQAQAVDIMGFLSKYVVEKSGIKRSRWCTTRPATASSSRRTPSATASRRAV